MKKKSASRSAFFNPRVLIGFVLCSIGVLLALVGWSKSVTDSFGNPVLKTGMSATLPNAANPVPLINQPLVPDAIAPGGAGFTLTVNGTGFVSGSVVNWNGTARATIFVSGSQLTATILASDIATANTGAVTVANPSPGGGNSNTVFLPVTNPSSSVAFSRLDFATPITPLTAAAGDFNRDGNIDIAVAIREGAAVSILLGNGDGTFQPRVDYSIVPARWVTIADFNGDGNLDLAAGSEDLAVVAILLGNGDGTFQTHVDYSTGAGPFSMIAADFNGDGMLDLASANLIDNTVSVLLGNGDGTFQSHIDFRTGVGPTCVVTGDFNQDNKLDLATADDYGNTVSVLFGNGDGTFSAPVHYAESTNPRSVATADLNGDGKLDLAIANEFSANVGVMLGNGDGSFQNATYYAAGEGPVWVDTADINGDGKLDLGVSHYDHGVGKTVALLLGIGEGTFQQPLSYRVGLAPEAGTIADFNNDGRLDVAVADGGSNTVSILLQTPAAVVSLSQTTLAFKTQLVGTTSKQQSVTLTNAGGATLTISSIAASGDFLAKNNCGSSVPAGSSCTISVSFNPSAKGVRTGTVTITDNAADSPQTIALTGTGTVVQVSPSALNFGDQTVGTTSEPQTATITNISSEDLHITGVGLGGANFGDFAATTTCGSKLAAGGSCTINVTFTPTTRGEKHASVLIADGGGGSPQHVPLTGTGVLH